MIHNLHATLLLLDLTRNRYRSRISNRLRRKPDATFAPRTGAKSEKKLAAGQLVIQESVAQLAKAQEESLIFNKELREQLARFEEGSIVRYGDLRVMHNDGKKALHVRCTFVS